MDHKEDTKVAPEVVANHVALATLVEGHLSNGCPDGA